MKTYTTIQIETRLSRAADWIEGEAASLEDYSEAGRVSDLYDQRAATMGDCVRLVGIREDGSWDVIDTDLRVVGA